ncbi:MAG: alpha/beta fold hydrolase [Betaproteobacteria bacterium]|nr:alpha/beta fold hydrolase [Betaproteobacteria bacterium]
MRTELLTFEVADGFPLDGVVYTPDAGAAKRAALLVHGKVMNFYTGPGRILPPHLARLGWSSLSMNRRGHDLGGIRNSRDSYGGAWEKFGDSQFDIAGGVAELKRRGFSRVALIGHSFGGISSAAYAAAHAEEVAALVLCSAGGGGRDYLAQSSRRGMLAGERHAEVDAEARRLVAEGRGDQIIPVPGWWYAITAASWVDLSEKVPSTVENARLYPGPILALRGSKEAPDAYPVEAVAAAAGTRATLAVIPGADHFYNGVEAEFARVVCDWLSKTVTGQA